MPFGAFIDFFLQLVRFRHPDLAGSFKTFVTRLFDRLIFFQFHHVNNFSLVNLKLTFTFRKLYRLEHFRFKCVIQFSLPTLEKVTKN